MKRASESGAVCIFKFYRGVEFKFAIEGEMGCFENLHFMP